MEPETAPAPDDAAPAGEAPAAAPDPEPAIAIEPARPIDAVSGPDPAGGLMETIASAFDFIALGGPINILLCAMSVFSLALIVAKAWQFARSGVGSGRAAEAALALWRQGDPARAQGAARAGRGPASAAMAYLIDGATRGVPAVALREEVIRLAADRIEELRSWLRTLETIASLAPLIGLTGTVVGMIKAFSALEQAGSRVDPATLSGGIWVAFLTTAGGLACAIPAIAALNWFEGRIERLERRIDSLVSGFFATEAGLSPRTEEGAPREPRVVVPRAVARA